MGGAPRVIRKVISPIKKVVRPPSSPIAERRVEVAKKTEAVEKKVAPRKLKRRSRKRTQLMATSQNTGLATGSDYSPIRNPRDTGSKLGSA
jgi:hypothetical protein|tara:strand:+ start:661 stop:933 length:273 start_codon:yes stop_codon:yes gene_type:complete